MFDWKKALQVLGEVDGGLAVAAFGWAQADPSHTKLAMGLAAIAGGLGIILNRIAKVYGVAPVAPEPPAGASVGGAS